MNVFVDPSFDPVPSLQHQTAVSVVDQDPGTGTLVVFVSTEGELPAAVTLDRDQLKAAGFTGKSGETLNLPGSRHTVLVGVGKKLATPAKVRDAVAAATRAAKDASEFVFDFTDLLGDGLCVRRSAAGTVEGAVLARYSWDALKNKANTTQLETVTVVVNSDQLEKAEAGAAKGKVFARSAALARDLGNTPPRHLNAADYAELIEKLAPQFGLETEVYDRKKIEELGLGGLLGVNAGSVQEPRVVKLKWRPENANGHIAWVGKGIMYDSGGISLKPSNPSHASMKMDMMGSAAVFAAMTALRDRDVKTAVTGWLMCTDNMPSGSATKLGDVLTMRNGKTVEVRNTDAEGRLVLGDGLALATEETPRPDVLVDVATLTGAALMALGEETTALFANNDSVAQQLTTAADETDDVVWRMPLDHRLKAGMKSTVADFANIGSAPGGAITAALYLNEFVDGIPWGHLDIAGTMEVTSDTGWRSAGSTGVGARILAEFAEAVEKPEGDVDTGDED